MPIKDDNQRLAYAREYARERRRKEKQRERVAMGQNRVGHRVERSAVSATRQDYLARLAEIPVDTRGLTATICGDPLPSRSALAQRMRAY